LHLAAKQREDSIKNANLQRLGNLDYTNEKQLQEIDKLTETVEIQERKYVIAAGLATVLFVILGIIGYLIYSIKKKNLEIDSQKKAIEELKIKEALVEGQTIERKRVAAELHDNIGSTISGLKYQLQALNLKNENSSVKEIFTRLVDMIDSAYNNIRKLSHNLMPEELEQNGLIGALQKLIDNLNVSDDVFFKLKVHGQIPPISREVTLELYGCCLETINNITRHANATKVFIDVSFLDGQLIIEVKDNGKGFSVTKQRLGNGLKNLESRIQKIKGKISISSEIEVGTKISFEAEPIVQI
jgi:signal transduction histidine kinase